MLLFDFDFDFTSTSYIGTGNYGTAAIAPLVNSKPLLFPRQVRDYNTSPIITSVYAPPSGRF